MLAHKQKHSVSKEQKNVSTSPDPAIYTKLPRAKDWKGWPLDILSAKHMDIITKTGLLSVGKQVQVAYSRDMEEDMR